MKWNSALIKNRIVYVLIVEQLINATIAPKPGT